MSAAGRGEYYSNTKLSVLYKIMNAGHNETISF